MMNFISNFDNVIANQENLKMSDLTICDHICISTTEWLFLCPVNVHIFMCVTL